MQQKPTSTVTKGFVIGLVIIAVTLGLSFSGMDMNSSLRWLPYVIFMVGIVLSINQFGKQVNYNSTFGNYFAHGFKISALVTIIMIAYTVIFISAFPEFKEKGLEAARKAMEEQKTMSEDEINTGIEMTKRFFMVALIGGVLLFYIITGCIASLIGAAVTKKDPRPLDDVNQISA